MRGSMFWGLVLVVLGGLFLLANLGFLPGGVWAVFWPLVLILLGGMMLYRIVAGPRPAAAEEAEIPLQGAAGAKLTIRHGAGRLHLSSGTKPGTLLSGVFVGGLEQRVRQVGDRLHAEINPEYDRLHFAVPWNWGPGGAYDWTFGLTDAVPLDLEIECGANEAHLDLSGIRASRLSLKTGASSTDLVLPGRPVGTCPARVEAGAAAVQIRLPVGAEAFVRTTGGLSEISVDKTRFKRVPSGYQSAGYATAVDRIDLDVSMGVGSVHVG